MTQAKPMSMEEYFQKLSDKLGEPIESLKAELDEFIAEVEKDPKFAKATAEQKLNLAKNRFSTRKVRETSIPNLISWEGVLLGAGDLVDTIAKQRKNAEAAFKANPENAMKGCVFNDVQILTNENGVALYPHTEANIKFGRAGKPLAEHSWLRTIFAFLRPIDPKTKQAGPAQFSKFMFNNAPAIDVSKLPINQKVKFKAINKTTENDRLSGEYTLNFSSSTKFEVANFDMPALEDVLPMLPQYQTLGELDSYHTKNKDDPRRIVITEGSVVNMNLEPNAKTGNIYLIIGDVSLLLSSSGATGVMCWAPTDRNITIDFANETKVFIIGKTNRGQARDPITKETLEGVEGDVMMNVYGLYAPELYKVPAAQVEPISASSVTAEKKEWT